ncbi:MAG TPA: class I SAM-dependent methyltransferase [Solirubrobacteraceae bacterium]|jgi:SAM-dependent methyltransferase|nr:class I SAM-dependent methyltransferase [Solirubrobacteraceae bacterium]
MAAPQTAAQIRAFNERYHDVAAEDYDAKWGIDFGLKGRRQVLGKLDKALGRGPHGPFASALEVGAGTGYFSLNLLRAGVVGRATCVDISPGMLHALEGNADRLALEVTTRACDAEALPFGDGAFDLVLGHAVLHHLPDLRRAFGEFHRVLRPGGTLVFAGEPSRYGDRLASVPKRAAGRLAPAWRAAVRAAPAPWANGGAPDADHALEHVVDVHAFAPGELRRLAGTAGFERIRVRGEELLASWFGWANRSLEATADPDQVPWLWRQYAYRGYLVLQQVDRVVLEPRLPPGMFYNLMVSARRP